MLFFGTFIFIISLLKGEAPQSNVDAVLLQQVKDSYRQCLVIVDAVGKLDDDLNENRRRSDDVATNASSKLKVCAEMVKSAEVFNRQYYAVTRSVLQVLQPSEISFLKNLLKSAGKKMGKILYVASLDGDNSREFHRLCDDQGPTVVVVETTAGVILGGYNSISWSSKIVNKKAPTSFLFQIRPSMISFSKKTGSTNVDIVNHPDVGPTFGCGNDLRIVSGATNNKKSFTIKCTYSMSSRYQLNNGWRTFQVKDYIVIKAV